MEVTGAVKLHPVPCRTGSPLNPSGVTLRGAEEILDADVRRSAITSRSIGVRELELLLGSTEPDAQQADYEDAVVQQNVLGLKTAAAREWRFKTFRRLYQLTPQSVLFRALRDLWDFDPAARPLLACLCAMTRDTVFRATAKLTCQLSISDKVSATDFIAPIEDQFPSTYNEKTIRTIAQKAYASWRQTGHLGEAEDGARMRTRAFCRPADVTYALLLGHLQGHRGEALFETVWARVLDHPRSHLHEQAFAASQGGMLEYRHGGGVIEVGFRELLRPIEGQLP